MRPRPHHQHIDRARIVLLDRAIDVERPRRVFGVVPSADIEHGAFHVVHEFPQRTPAPEFVIIRMVNDLLPVASLAAKQLLVDFSQWAKIQKEVITIGRARVERYALLRWMRLVAARTKAGI